VDGQQVDSRSDANLPDALADTIYVGSTLWHDQQAEATLDELRISDVPRLGNGDACNYRILVADSSNFRIQAFDALGAFISEYGSFGGGNGQFRYPRGLAVDGNGRLLVADSGNDRLQVLNFDGTNFSFVQNIRADFSWPMGVTTFGDQRIIVADTGNNLIKLLDMNGNLLTTYTEPNDGYTGPFNQPQGIVVNRLYQIVVADRGNQRVVTITGALPLHNVYAPLIWAGPPQEENP
jgi:DNA-binding beta-propeller fold protein YncE